MHTTRYMFLFLTVFFYSSCRDRTPTTKKDTESEVPETRLLISISQRQSLGEAESHGSVRMANAEVIELGRVLMEQSGTKRSEEWFNRVLSDSVTMESVKLEKSIPLTNVE